MNQSETTSAAGGGETYSVLKADHARRIQALGAAISRRDWSAVEQAHAEIRDAFDRPDIYDRASPPPPAGAAGGGSGDLGALSAGATLQERNAEWMKVAFDGDPTDLAERVARFGEEALELQQALGQSREDAIALVEYVYGRPVGKPDVEFGQAAGSLACLAEVAGYNLDACADAELARISTPEFIAKVRAKRSTRHGRGPLPGFSAPTPDLGAQGEPVAWAYEELRTRTFDEWEPALSYDRPGPASWFRNIEPLFKQAPAAPRTASGVSVGVAGLIPVALSVEKGEGLVRLVNELGLGEILSNLAMFAEAVDCCGGWRRMQKACLEIADRAHDLYSAKECELLSIDGYIDAWKEMSILVCTIGDRGGEIYNLLQSVIDAPAAPRAGVTESQTKDKEDLAKLLWQKMEHIDPSCGDLTWDTAEETERDFCRSCIDHLFMHTDVIHAAATQAPRDGGETQGVPAELSAKWACEELARIKAVIPASLAYEVPDTAEAVASTFREFVKAAAEATALRKQIAALKEGIGEPFMTCRNGVIYPAVELRYRNLQAAQTAHSALVTFFKEAPTPPSGVETIRQDNTSGGK